MEAFPTHLTGKSSGFLLLSVCEMESRWTLLTARDPEGEVEDGGRRFPCTTKTYTSINIFLTTLSVKICYMNYTTLSTRPCSYNCMDSQINYKHEKKKTAWRFSVERVGHRPIQDKQYGKDWHCNDKPAIDPEEMCSADSINWRPTWACKIIKRKAKYGSRNQMQGCTALAGQSGRSHSQAAQRYWSHHCRSGQSKTC